VGADAGGVCGDGDCSIVIESDGEADFVATRRIIVAFKGFSSAERERSDCAVRGTRRNYHLVLVDVQGRSWEAEYGCTFVIGELRRRIMMPLEIGAGGSGWGLDIRGGGLRRIVEFVSLWREIFRTTASVGKESAQSAQTEGKLKLTKMSEGLQTSKRLAVSKAGWICGWAEKRCGR